MTVIFYSMSPPSIYTLWLTSTSTMSNPCLNYGTVSWTCLEMCSLWSPGWSPLDITEVSPRATPLWGHSAARLGASGPCCLLTGCLLRPSGPSPRGTSQGVWDITLRAKRGKSPAFQSSGMSLSSCFFHSVPFFRTMEQIPTSHNFLGPVS